MSNPPSNDSICVCENCMELHFDRHKIDVLTNDVLDDLNALYIELQQDMEKCENQETRDLKFQKLLVKLEAIENAVVYIHNDIKDENNLRENLDSNFGISVQIETLAEDLENEKKNHDKLRIEWYSQEEHLSRLVDKVRIQDTALENQSIYCTTQGFTLSKMLWKISNRNELLDKILLNEILTQGIFQTFKNCLEAFTLTYRGNNMPKPTSPEYQYVLSLAGTISNVSAVPDGRFFIINHVIGESVLNEIINSLPKVRAPNAESLKWIMLTIIHNMLVCKEGEEYCKRNQLLLSNVIKCTNKPNSERVIILALKILASLTTGVSDEMYMELIMKSIPVKGLKQLKKGGESSKVSKHATCVLSSIMKISQNYRSIENEKLIRTTKLNDSRSSCIIKSKQKSSQGKICGCSDANKIKDKRSSSTVKPQPSRSSQSKTCCCSDVNKIKDRRLSSTVEPQSSKPSDTSKTNACCCCPKNETKKGRSSRSRSSSAVRRKSSKPSRSSQVNTCCCCPVNKVNTGRSSSIAESKPSRTSTFSQVNNCCCPINTINDGRSSSTVRSKLPRPSRSSQVNTCCCCPVNNTSGGRSNSAVGPKSSRPSRSSQVNTSCCPVNNTSGGRSSSTVRRKSSKPSRPSKGNTCCCYVNKIKRYISNENISSTSVSDIDQSNGNYTSSIFSKHPTQSSITIMSADDNFNSKSSSLCFCSSELTNMSLDENKTRHKRKQFYTSATNSVTCRAPQMNLTIQFKSGSNTSSIDETSMNKEISLNLDFDPIRGPSDSVVDREGQKVVENQSTKCIQCSHEEIAGTSTATDEEKNETTNAEHD